MQRGGAGGIPHVAPLRWKSRQPDGHADNHVAKG